MRCKMQVGKEKNMGSPLPGPLMNVKSPPAKQSGPEGCGCCPFGQEPFEDLKSTVFRGEIPDLPDFPETESHNDKPFIRFDQPVVSMAGW